MLTLKEFVKETLNQIIDAALEVRKERSEAGVTVFPDVRVATIEASGQHGIIFLGYNRAKERQDYATMIDFDVAVSAEDSETATAGGGVRVVALLKAEGTLESQTANASLSRVRFKLPLQLG